MKAQSKENVFSETPPAGSKMKTTTGDSALAFPYPLAKGYPTNAGHLSYLSERNSIVVVP